MKDKLNLLIARFGYVLITKKEYLNIRSKLKEQEKHLQILIEEPESTEALIIRRRHILHKAIEEAVLFGKYSDLIT